MIKYVSYAITFTEIPDEVCLSIQISNCKYTCKGCHSAYLQKDIGEDLEKDLPQLLSQFKDRVTCVCLMGEGRDESAFERVVKYIHDSGFKVAVYSGATSLYFYLLQYSVPDKFNFNTVRWRNLNEDYVKIGPYMEDRGGLDNPNTNQVLYKWDDKSEKWVDITYKFLERKHNG